MSTIQRKHPSAGVKQAEHEELRFLKAALASSGEGVIIVDAEGRQIFINEAGRRIAQRMPLPGVRVEEQAGRLKLRYPDGRPIPPEETPLSRALRGERVADFLVVLGTPDGAATYISNTASPVQDERGDIVGAVSVFRDITERRRAEEERERLLAEVEKRRQLFEAVIEGVPAGVVVLSWPDLIYELANPAYQAMVPGKKLLGRTLREVFPEIADQIEPLMGRVMSTRQAYHAVDLPLRIRRAPDAPLEEAYFTFSYLPISTIEGRDAVLVLAIDTTEEVRARGRIEELAEAARRRAAELDATLNAFAVGYTITDMAGRILHMNPAAQSLLGYSEAERRLPVEERAKLLRVETADGKRLPPDELPECRALRGETVHGVIMALHRSGRRTVWVSAGAAPIRLPEGALLGTVLSFTDITALRELQAERERLLQAEHRAREEAEAALRLRDEFLSVAAHELKTPLTSLRGQAELTMERIEKGRIRDVQQVGRAMQVIDRQVDRLSTLVAQLLDISRIESGELELERRMTDLVPLVRGMIETMQAGATRHTLSLHAPEAVEVLVDPLRLEEVLYNLLDNAIRYSPKGGPVEVELSTPDPKTVRLAVRDHGIGVPPEQRGRLFTRFFQAAERPAGGLGLGLYISRRIVELHDGRIWAEFPEDGGSRFVVELPREGAW